MHERHKTRSHRSDALPESNDVARAAVISNFLRWLINSRMDEFYTQCELSLNHLFGTGVGDQLRILGQP